MSNPRNAPAARSRVSCGASNPARRTSLETVPLTANSTPDASTIATPSRGLVVVTGPGYPRSLPADGLGALVPQLGRDLPVGRAGGRLPHLVANVVAAVGQLADRRGGEP